MAKLVALPRFSFLSPKEGGVKRLADNSGSWVEQYEVIKIIDDAMNDDTITLPITEYEQTLKDAERFKHIADFERVTATNKFSVQVIGNNNNYYMEYFKCEKPYLGAQFLHETKLDALRAGVDKAIKELPNG
jgi:hypothetical protein